MLLGALVATSGYACHLKYPRPSLCDLLTIYPILDRCVDDSRPEGMDVRVYSFVISLFTMYYQAMQHIFHKSAYNYIKRRDLDQVARNFFGPGIVAAPGDNRFCMRFSIWI